MSYTPYEKGTVLAPSGAVEHLHIVCANPIYSVEHGCDVVLVVNVSSIPAAGQYDNSCILTAGEHDFIRHRSYLVYRRAVLWRCPTLSDKVAAGEYRLHDDATHGVMQRVISGFNASEHTSFKILRFIAKYGN